MIVRDWSSKILLHKIVFFKKSTVFHQWRLLLSANQPHFCTHAFLISARASNALVWIQHFNMLCNRFPCVVKNVTRTHCRSYLSRFLDYFDLHLPLEMFIAFEFQHFNVVNTHIHTQLHLKFRLLNDKILYRGDERIEKKSTFTISLRDIPL